MKLLLDTCTFLWMIQGSDDLSAESRSLLANPLNEVQLSAVSTWEIALKVSLGRLPFRSLRTHIFKSRENGTVLNFLPWMTCQRSICCGFPFSTRTLLTGCLFAKHWYMA